MTTACRPSAVKTSKLFKQDLVIINVNECHYSILIFDNLLSEIIRKGTRKRKVSTFDRFKHQILPFSDNQGLSFPCDLEKKIVERLYS